MSHVDDGKLNALLDGELDAAESAAVHAHIAGCAECTKRLDEATRFLTGAADLLGALELPATVNVPAAPARRVSKTAREVAIDLDGATHKSPAIRPNLPETPPAPPARPRLDFTTLSWAAMVVLALGVGYLADEAMHPRDGGPAAEGSAGRGSAQQHTVPPVASPATAAPRPSSPSTSRTALTSGAAARTKTTPPVRSTHGAAAPTIVAAKAGAPSAGKHLAAPKGNAARRPTAAAGATHELAAAGAGARVQDAAAPRRAPQPLPAASAAEGPAAGNAAALGVTGVAAPRDALVTFRRVTLEEAVARLNGVIRLMDGMRFEQVELGPGLLVPGADRGRDLVRLIYFDSAGRRLLLDQQRITLPTAGGIVSSDIGMGRNDTLTTAVPGGETRLRWIEGTFWLSLSGNLPPDELRQLIRRVR
jgi:anti-sigma factor RsiW